MTQKMKLASRPAIALMIAALSSVAGASERKVAVTGSCSREVTPDRAEITLTAEKTDKDLAAASRDVTLSYNRLRDSVTRLKLADQALSTSEYQVREVREWEKGKTVSKGFRARMGLRVVSSDVQRLGEVIALAAREGIQDVGELRTFLSDEKLRSEQFACLQSAAEDARTKAERLASSLKSSIGEVLQLQENIEGQPQAFPMAKMEMRTDAVRGVAPPPPPQVEAGKQRISASVSAVFQLK